ncbi:BMP family lipoprotein [Lactobacillus mulieris]|uniref:BMP family protein n=1 Tax=Lactobacillus mulieris TaxID=2508708 RepID=A0AAW5WYR3_9LACO|nr:BMP family protein [Lactobacillus mulieris]MCZ3622388.1 BMP family protein [Lactobacillus mulieris]MCZ3624059.1 BMP family protein [Lactobacillus mulieris]MCZ3636429.1 BMP family protein [Lactobacillus mulieris]MCZ3690681.1 BMP family protein [Lactobacillus mulieris]MCZ3695933.1 BMP family protein [Lactobacillus mulieris]
MNLKKVAILGVATLSAFAMTACSNKTATNSNGKKNKGTVALITDGNGVNDHSFNESAWNGFLAYGKEHNLTKGSNGYQYFQTSGASEFVPNLEQAAKNYDTIYGIGYQLKDAVSTVAKKYPKKNFAIVDDVIKGQKNVVSANFLSNQAAYLAGVAAAYETKTNVVGFIGGAHGDIVDLFDAGFTKGVNDTAKKLGKKITILNQYIGDFNSSDKAKSIAQTMYAKKADIVMHAAGGAGDGLFEEAKAINQTKKASDKVWVIGVDTDQSNLGNYKSKDGKKSNFVLTSVITGVNVAVKDIADRAYEGKFPGGKNLIYGLDTNGVSITKGQISSKAWKASRTARTAIIDGKISVPKHPSK